MIALQERWHTWFCIYRRETLVCDVSHHYHEEYQEGPVRRVAYDDAGWRQHILIRDYGYVFACLDPKYSRCFIHYGGFAKNADITGRNVSLYRRLAIMRRRGIAGHGSRLLGIPYQIVFGRVRRDKYLLD